MKAVTDQPPPSSDQKSRATATRSRPSTPRKPTRAFYVIGAKEVGEVQLGRGALLCADGGAIQLLGRGHAELLPDHETLAVVVIDGGKIEAELGVARHRPGRVAHQNVDLAGLQGGEAVLPRERDEANLRRIVENRRCVSPAVIHVEPGPVALRIRDAEAGQRRVRAADEKALLLDVVQRRLS